MLILLVDVPLLPPLILLFYEVEALFLVLNQLLPHNRVVLLKENLALCIIYQPPFWPDFIFLVEIFKLSCIWLVQLGFHVTNLAEISRISRVTLERSGLIDIRFVSVSRGKTLWVFRGVTAGQGVSSARVKGQGSVLARWSVSNLLLTLCRFVNASHGCPAPWVQPYAPTHTHLLYFHIYTYSTYTYICTHTYIHTLSQCPDLCDLQISGFSNLLAEVGFRYAAEMKMTFKTTARLVSFLHIKRLQPCLSSMSLHTVLDGISFIFVNTPIHTASLLP